MVGAEAVLGEEQVLGPITPLLLPIGILIASFAHEGPVLALYEASFLEILKESVSGLLVQPILQ